MLLTGRCLLGVLCSSGRLHASSIQRQRRPHMECGFLQQYRLQIDSGLAVRALLEGLTLLRHNDSSHHHYHHDNDHHNDHNQCSRTALLVCSRSRCHRCRCCYLDGWLCVCDSSQEPVDCRLFHASISMWVLEHRCFEGFFECFQLRQTSLVFVMPHDLETLTFQPGEWSGWCLRWGYR